MQEDFEVCSLVDEKSMDTYICKSKDNIRKILKYVACNIISTFSS